MAIQRIGIKSGLNTRVSFMEDLAESYAICEPGDRKPPNVKMSGSRISP